MHAAWNWLHRAGGAVRGAVGCLREASWTRPALCAAVVLGLYAGMAAAVRARDVYRIRSDAVRVADLPSALVDGRVRSDLEGVLAPFAGTSVFDRDLLSRVAQRAADLPWVARVAGVSYRFGPGGAGISFDLEARMPVARLQSRGVEVLIDGAGRVLPIGAYHGEGMGLPWLEGLGGSTPRVGDRLTDPRVRCALDVIGGYAARGFADREPGLGLRSLRIRTGAGNDADIVALTQDRKELRFSRPDLPGRLSVADQLDRLDEALADPRVWYRVHEYVDLRFADQIPAR